MVQKVSFFHQELERPVVSRLLAVSPGEKKRAWNADTYNVEMRKEQKCNFNKRRLGHIIFYIFLTQVVRLLCIYYHLGQNFEKHASVFGFKKFIYNPCEDNEYK